MALTEWTCDTCDKPITDAHNALVIWHSDQDHRAYGFRFVHKGRACDPDRSASSWELHDALGMDGQAWWLSFLSYGRMFGAQKPGVVDMDEFVDAFRRAQTPFYEEARPYLRTDEVADSYGDANEVAVYQPGALANIADLGKRTYG